MKLGMPALVEYTSLKQLIDLGVELKLNFIELNMNLPYNFIEKIEPAELKYAAKETNLEFTMHMPDEADLGSFYDSVRQGYLQLFSATIDWSKEAGVKLLNLHIVEGPKMTLPDKKVYIYDQYSDEFTNKFIKSIEVLSKKAKENNIILSIENSSNFGKKFIQKTLDKALTYPQIQLTWDTGHDAVSNFTDKKYLLANKSHLGHMHLHDAKGGCDHQVLFEGELNIKELLNFAEQKGMSVLLEVKTAEALKKSLANLKKQGGKTN